MHQNALKSTIESQITLPSGISVELVRHSLALSGEVSLDRSPYILSRLLCSTPPLRMYFIEETLKKPVDVGGATVLLPPHMPFMADQAAGTYRTIRCRITPELFHATTGLPNGWGQQWLEICCNLTDHRIDDAMMEMAEEIREPGYASDKLIEHRCMSLMIYLGRKLSKDISSAAPIAGGLSSWQMRRIDEYLHSIHGQPARLNEMASLCGISGGHLSRAFKNTRGTTIQQFAERILVTRAKSMLMENNRSIKEISWILGYCQPSSFSTAFKKAVGTTPDQYRRQFL